jgi:hypothetical protein
MADTATFPATPLPRRGLVPAARVLLLVNALLLALAVWWLLPVDVSVSTGAHLALTLRAFLIFAAVSALPFGGWKAVCLAFRWRADGSLVWAWAWLALFAGYGAYCAYSVMQLA